MPTATRRLAGGGEDQANLMDAVVTPENLRNFVCVIAVDLDDVCPPLRPPPSRARASRNLRVRASRGRKD